MQETESIPSWWKVFICEFLKNGENAALAMRQAKPHLTQASSEVEASRLLRNSKFYLVLKEEKRKMNEQLDFNFKRWLSELERIAAWQPEDINVANKLKALELIGRAKRFFPETKNSDAEERVRQFWIGIAEYSDKCRDEEKKRAAISGAKPEERCLESNSSFELSPDGIKT